MTRYKKRDIYYLDDFNVLKNEKITDLNNKLFCTFTDQEGVDPLKYLYFMLKVMMNMFAHIMWIKAM